MNKSGKVRKSKQERMLGRELTESDFGSQLNRFSMPQDNFMNSNLNMGATRADSFYGNSSS